MTIDRLYLGHESGLSEVAQSLRGDDKRSGDVGVEFLFNRDCRLIATYLFKASTSTTLIYKFIT